MLPFLQSARCKLFLRLDISDLYDLMCMYSWRVISQDWHCHYSALILIKEKRREETLECGMWIYIIVSKDTRKRAKSILIIKIQPA